MCRACYSWDGIKLLQAALISFKAAWLPLRSMDVEIREGGVMGISKTADMKLLVTEPSHVIEVFQKAR
jgi:hypothetical protein